MKYKLLLLLVFSTAPAIGASNAPITAADFGAQWPFMFERGVLGCQPDSRAPNLLLITFTDPSGNTYAINGAASSRATKRGWLNVQAIWKENPGIPGTKISITPIIQRGSALCGTSKSKQ